MVEHSLLNGTVLGAEFDIIFGQHSGTDGRLSAGLPARWQVECHRVGGGLISARSPQWPSSFISHSVAQTVSEMSESL